MKKTLIIIFSFLVVFFSCKKSDSSNSVPNNSVTLVSSSYSETLSISTYSKPEPVNGSNAYVSLSSYSFGNGKQYDLELQGFGTNNVISGVGKYTVNGNVVEYTSGGQSYVHDPSYYSTDSIKIITRTVNSFTGTYTFHGIVSGTQIKKSFNGEFNVTK